MRDSFAMNILEGPERNDKEDYSETYCHRLAHLRRQRSRQILV